MLDLIEDYLEDEEDDEVVDWISRFPETTTSLESLVFDCVAGAFNFEALEALVARSPGLRRLRVNHHVTLEQLRRLMARAPQLTHLGTGAFRSGSVGAEAELDLTSSFAASKSLVCLSGFREVEPEYLPAIYPVCANLTSLNFSFANLTAEELKPVIQHCRNLRTFWVLLASHSSCKRINFLFGIKVETSENVLLTLISSRQHCVINHSPPATLLLSRVYTLNT